MKTSYCHTSSDVPKTEHFAIVIFSSIWIEGDERSRTHPGHGYPAHSESKAEYRAFTDRTEWEREVERYAERKDNYVAMIVKPATVETKVQVKISP